MRLLVLSDSHGDEISLRMAIDNNLSADAVIFLGDGLRDWENSAERIKAKITVSVKGNCDTGFSFYPVNAAEDFGNVRVYCTHGYAESVKYGFDRLIERAKSEGAQIALFGHTHTPYTSYEDGVYLLNPGSVRQNSCGIVDITTNGIMCYTKNIVPDY